MGESTSRAFAEWQRETTLPESGSYSMGWARVKVGLRVLSVLRSDFSVNRLQEGGRKISSKSVAAIKRAPAKVVPLRCNHLLNRLETKLS